MGGDISKPQGGGFRSFPLDLFETQVERIYRTAIDLG